MITFTVMELVILHMQAVWASLIMAVLKKHEYRSFSDYCAVNKQIVKGPGVMPDLEVGMGRLRGASTFATVDLFSGYRRCPLAEEARKLFTIAAPKGLFKPTRDL